MAKDTQQEAPKLTDAQLQAWIDASPENAAAFSTAYTAQNTVPGAAEQVAWDQATQEYRQLRDAYALLPKDEMGAGDNDAYRALKLAQDAKEAAMSDYFSAVRGTTEDPFRYNPRNNPELSYFTDAEGNFGLGIRPENLYYNDYSGTMVEGIAKGVAPSDSPFGGVGTEGHGDLNGQDPFAPPPNYQQSGGTGLPNGGIPEGYLPDSSGNSYWDFISNGGTVPNYPRPTGSPAQTPPSYTVNRPPSLGGTPPINRTPIVNENLGTAGGGVTGVAPSSPVNTGNWVEQLGGPLQGYESSSNKDFYQKQFQEMNAMQRGQKNADFAAAIRREQAAQNPQTSVMDDPWSWANLPEVQMGTGGVSGPTTYELNPRFDWGGDTTNQQIIQDLNLSGDELSYLQKNPKKFENAPSFLDQNAFQEFIASNPGDRGYTDTLNKIYQATWTPVPGSTGPIVPVGYASPINVQGAV